MPTTNIFDMADTWNNGATTFNAIRMNVTDTASASNSLLMDLAVGGTSRFTVGKGGNVVASGAITGASVNVGASDVVLERDAASALALRSGTTAQAFRVYNTFTDASNYERGFIRWSANAFDVGVEALGTGSTGRELNLRSGGDFFVFRGATNVIRAGTTFVGFVNGMHVGSTPGSPDFGFIRQAAGIGRVVNGLGGSTGASIEFLEQTAPAAGAANTARIFAEDNGSGKTRLMVRFNTGAAQQLAIEP